MTESNIPVSDEPLVEEQPTEVTVSKQGIVEQIEANLQELGPVQKDLEGNRLLVHSRCEVSECNIGIYLHGDLLTVYLLLPIFVPPDRRSAMAEHAIKYNYKRLVPIMDLSPEDGQVAFRVTSFVSPNTFDISVFRKMLFIVTAFAEQEFGNLLSLAFGESVEKERVQLN